MDEHISKKMESVLAALCKVLRVQDELGESASDRDVCRHASDISACVVTRNAVHFKKILHLTKRHNFRGASLVTLLGPEQGDLRRLQAALPILQNELDRRSTLSDGRLFAEISTRGVLIEC